MMNDMKRLNRMVELSQILIQTENPRVCHSVRAAAIQSNLRQLLGPAVSRQIAGVQCKDHHVWLIVPDPRWCQALKERQREIERGLKARHDFIDRVGVTEDFPSDLAHHARSGG